jgi:hypothetical protein
MSDKEGDFTAKDAKSAKDNYYLKWFLRVLSDLCCEISLVRI